MVKSLIIYIFFRCSVFPLQFLSYSIIGKLGSALGLLIYYCYPRYRKRALSNLALATDLRLTPPQIIALAKASMQNLAITFLEYPKLYREKNIHSIAVCENPEVADRLIQNGKGVIFFCGHQANWEVLFLEGTSRMPGVAIGRPIKNRFLYEWVVRLREKFGGKIIQPKNAYFLGVKALKAGKFLGIVGDQAVPESPFKSPFFGRKAFTSPLPALLSKKTGCPIIVATIRREQGKYIIHYSDPIEPQEDTNVQMKQVVSLFESSVRSRPHEWLWIHNKWKQQPPGRLNRDFRHDAVAFIFHEEAKLLGGLLKLRQLYPHEQLTLFVPEGIAKEINPCLPFEVITYKTPLDLLIPDYRFKLIIDFTHNPVLTNHFKKLSALKTMHFKTPKEMFQRARAPFLPPTSS